MFGGLLIIMTPCAAPTAGNGCRVLVLGVELRREAERQLDLPWTAIARASLGQASRIPCRAAAWGATDVPEPRSPERPDLHRVVLAADRDR